MFWDFFFTFFKIGVIGFGGGFAILPLIQNEINSHGWLLDMPFSDIVSVSVMAPGPTVANASFLVGLESQGFPGALISLLGVILPSFLIIILLGGFLKNHKENKYVVWALYGLRSVISGVIFYSAYRFGIQSGIFGSNNFVSLPDILIAAAAFFLLLKTKINPAILLGAAGVLGLIFYR